MTDKSDTDPSELAPDDSERTPLEAPYSLKAISLKLDRTLTGISTVADNQSDLLARFGRFEDAFGKLAKRVTALEISQRWLPLAASFIAIAVALWTRYSR